MAKLQFIPDTHLKAPHHSRPIIYDARYQPTGTPKPVIIFVHGFKGFKDWGPFNLLADKFASEGFVFTKLNLSHNGTTPEKPTEFADLDAFGKNNFSIELDDLGIFIDHLENGESSIPSSEADLSGFLLIGHSRGGGLVILKASEDPRIKALASWAGIHDVDQRWPDEFIEEWKRTGVQYIYNSRTNQQMPLYYQVVEDYYENKERLDIPAAVANMKQPHLIVHGTEDTTVPQQAALQMGKLNPKAEVFLLKEANHTFGGQHPLTESVLPEHMGIVIGKTIDFFRKHF